MHPTYRQIKYYILYCITQLTVWYFWVFHVIDPAFDQLAFTSVVLMPFILSLVIFSILFLPFYIRREDD